MSLAKTVLHELAEKLNAAEVSRVPIEPLSKLHPDLTEEEAYAIQWINVARCMREGHRVVGYKAGLTSREAQRQFNVFKPDFGHLFDFMTVLEDTAIDLSELIQPKIEGEVAFVLGKDLKGPGLTLVDVVSAIDYATTAIEIVDSRIRDWKISAVDTIADNGSSSRVVLAGTKHKLDGLNLPHLGMALSKNGEVMVTGAGAAVMGNPLSAVVFLANELAKQDCIMNAGQVILSGSLSSMLSIRPGDSFTCEIAELGKASIRFVQKERV